MWIEPLTRSCHLLQTRAQFCKSKYCETLQRINSSTSSGSLSSRQTSQSDIMLDELHRSDLINYQACELALPRDFPIITSWEN